MGVHNSNYLHIIHWNYQSQADNSWIVGGEEAEPHSIPFQVKHWGQQCSENSNLCPGEPETEWRQRLALLRRLRGGAAAHRDGGPLHRHLGLRGRGAGGGGGARQGGGRGHRADRRGRQDDRARELRTVSNARSLTKFNCSLQPQELRERHRDLGAGRAHRDERVRGGRGAARDDAGLHRGVHRVRLGHSPLRSLTRSHIQHPSIFWNGKTISTTRRILLPHEADEGGRAGGDGRDVQDRVPLHDRGQHAVCRGARYRAEYPSTPTPVSWYLCQARTAARETPAAPWSATTLTAQTTSEVSCYSVRLLL